MAVKRNIRDGSRLSSRTSEPAQYVEVVDVDGLPADPDRALYEAYQHPDFPREGTPWRANSSFIVSAVDGEMIAPDVARFQVVYTEAFGDASLSFTTSRKEETAEGLIQIGATLTTVETQRDNEGTPLTVSFIDASGTLDTQGVTVEVSAPAVERRIERVETQPDLSLAEEFTGAVNDGPIWGRDARTLLASVSFQSRDGGATWLASYEFRYRPDTWDVFVFHKDPETGSPTDGISLDNGIERKRVLPERNFGRLGIDFPR